MAGDVGLRLSAYMARLFGYAVSLTRNEDRARDIVQEAALRALKAKSVPEDESAFRAWLFTIVRNAAVDAHRRARHDSAPPDVALMPDAGIWGYDDRAIAGVTVRQGLRQLPEDAREVIALVDIAGFSYAEAARVLDIPVGTVMSRLSRARRALLTLIDKAAIRPFRLRQGR